METVYEGTYLRFIQDGHWEYVERTNGNLVVVIVPLTIDQEIIFVSQFRVPVQKAVLEFPAGLVGDVRTGEGPLEAAMAELLEETGYVSDYWEQLAEGPVSAGLSNEHIIILGAKNCVRVNSGGGADFDEKIDVHCTRIDGVLDFIHSCQKNGMAVDPKIYAGLFFLNELKGG